MKNYFTLKNRRGLEVELANLGASIYSIKFHDEYMTLTPKNKKDFENIHYYYGKTIGPIANRIENGVLTIDKEKFYYSKNEGNNTLHSGEEGIENRVFASEIEEDRVIFTLDDHGVHYRIIYEISDEYLYVKHEVTTDVDTPISLTNHAYFCLGSSSLDDLSLKMKSHYFIESRKEDLIPVRVKKNYPCLDFNKEKLISLDINDEYLINHRSKGYDHCLLLDKGVLRLSNDKYEMTLMTSYPAVHFYSDNYPDEVKMMTSKGNNHRGVAIEPEDNLLDRRILHPGERYVRFIKYYFVKK